MFHDEQTYRGVSENWINETAALTQWRSEIITSSHLANQWCSAHIYVNHAQKLIVKTGSLAIYCSDTYSIKPGSGHSSHGSEFSWLNHWVHTAVVTRKQQLISQPPVHSGSILPRLLITLHGKKYPNYTGEKGFKSNLIFFQSVQPAIFKDFTGKFLMSSLILCYILCHRGCLLSI